MMLSNNEQIILSIGFGILSFVIYAEFKDKLDKSSLEKYIPYVIFLTITIFNIWQRGKLKISELMLDDKLFLFWFLICIVFTIYVLSKKKVIENDEENNKIKESVRKAFIALIISYFSKLDLVIAPYFLVIVFSYFSYYEWV